jgi:apolipoprotein N-acyltransferase
LLLAGLGSGALLCLADHPLNVWPLGAVALVPFLAALGARPASRGAVALAALLFSVAYTVPLSLVLEFPLAMAVGQAAVVGAIFVVQWLGVARLVRLGPVAGPLGAAAWVALVEWANVTLIPIWGTAQSFVRTWAAWPPAMQSTALWGMTGLVFVLVAAQALVAGLLVSPSARPARALALAAVLAVPGVMAFRAAPTAGPALRVAVIGWDTAETPRAKDLVIEQVIAPNVGRAVAQGARLVVTPEVSVTLEADERVPTLERLGALAGAQAVALALGYFDVAAGKNRVAFFDASGALVGEYEKTHLIPFFENYHAGDGAIVSIAASPTWPTATGGMICQDDNFTDLARAHGRAGHGLVVVPTWDWAQVARFHFDNGRFRSVESGYAVARAAKNGISAIVSARGEVLAAGNALGRSPVLLVADVAPGTGRTIYARFGGLVPGLWALILAGAIAGPPWARRRASRSPRARA